MRQLTFSLVVPVAEGNFAIGPKSGGPREQGVGALGNGARRRSVTVASFNGAVDVCSGVGAGSVGHIDKSPIELSNSSENDVAVIGNEAVRCVEPTDLLRSRGSSERIHLSWRVGQSNETGGNIRWGSLDLTVGVEG